MRTKKDNGKIKKKVDVTLSAQESLNLTLEEIHHSAPDIDFPNYLAELSSIPRENADIELAERFVHAVLKRLIIPHYLDGNETRTNYFDHLYEMANELSEKNGIEINLYIGGGVIRTMLENIDKFVRERKEEQKKRPVKAKIITEALTADKMNIDSVGDIEKQMRLKRKALSSTEFHLRQAVLGEKEPLLAPFTLGVSNDFDIYYEVIPKKKELTSEEIESGRKVAKALTDYLSGQQENIKNSILPKPNVSEYNEQVGRASEQGGSLLDLLAFSITPSRGRFRQPANHPNIIKDFIEGFFEYIAPVGDKPASQEQSIRGLSPLLEMGFLDLKDNKILTQELKEILEQVEKGVALQDNAKLQFNKMVTNANDQLAKNRPYSTKPNEPLSLALEIAEAVFKQGGSGINDKVKFLLPAFLQQMPFDNRNEETARAAVQHYDELNECLMEKKDFVNDKTDKGILYHGTSDEAGICVLRGGFILSSSKQGIAGWGPGVYTTPDERVARFYAGKGFVIPMNIDSGPIKILDWSKVDNKLEEMLNQEAKEKQYEDVFDLLRDRAAYAVDIIIDYHVIIQNQNAINLPLSLETLLSSMRSQVISKLREMKEENDFLQDDYIGSLSIYLNCYAIFSRIGLKLTEEYNPINIIKGNTTLKEMGNLANNTLLLLACRNGLQEVVFDLINGGADIDAIEDDSQVLQDHSSAVYHYGGNLSGLMNAILNFHSELAVKLIQHDANFEIADKIGRTALMYACQKDLGGVAAELIERGADINAKDVMGHTALIIAIAGSHSELSMKMIQHGANLEIVDTYRETALMHACRNGLEEVVDEIINQGVDINVISNHDQTALIVAILCSRSELAIKLIKHGAKLEIADYWGRTALFFASEKGLKEVVLELIDRGANIDVQNKSGVTPLMSVLQLKDPAMAFVLIEAGASIEICDNNNKKALDYASPELRELILERVNKIKQRNQASDSTSLETSVDKDGTALRRKKIVFSSPKPTSSSSPVKSDKKASIEPVRKKGTKKDS